MYRKKTVFILGAGASYFYGYPLGNQLIPSMLKSLDDLIPIPIIRENKGQVFYNETDKKHGRLYDYEQTKKYLLAHTEFHETENKKFVPSSNSANRLQLFDGREILGLYFQNEFYCVRLGELDKFDELKNRLLSTNPISIDAFLRNNPDLNDVAKILIIYTLLKCENPNNFNLDFNGTDTKVVDAWLPILFNELTQGCSDSKSTLENNIEFINFNYDASFEYFFYRMFKETKLFSEDATVLIDFIQSRTHHVYGHLPTIFNLGNYGYYHDLNLTEDTITIQFYRFLQSLLNYESILTIHEERINKNHERIEKIVRDAEIINIIGFAFDRDNLNVLGFPNSSDHWGLYAAELNKPKTINYLNFNGLNTKLSSQFERITSRPDNGNLIANESRAKKISDALLYDFKTFLFEI